MRIHYKRNRGAPLGTNLQFRANEYIRVPEVYVIDEQGAPLGEMTTAKAIAIARERELDLVEVAPKAQPPVCRIIDYGQFKYQKEKEEKAKKSHAKKVEVKGIRLSVRMAENDFNNRLEKGKEFLSENQKIKIEIILRGREKSHGDLAIERIQEFIAALGKDFTIFVEQAVKRQGGNVSAIIGKK